DAAIARQGLRGQVMLAVGDATEFDAEALFGIAAFDRVFISYALSMIPGWERSVTAALAALKPGGSIHIVDFGGQDDLPGWFRTALRAWLAKFHVAPRDSLREVLESESRKTGANLEFENLFRGYAVRAVVTVPA
ncbi:MAG: SAM-dependent methyltransferase, partial [Mesorhizobium sp.]|nr:SAM-dependent methyltransferase [Mesorhizobium sp.]